MYLSNYFIVMFCKYFVINFLIGLAKATFNNKKKTKFIENFLTSASIFCLKKKKKNNVHNISIEHRSLNSQYT